MSQSVYAPPAVAVPVQGHHAILCGRITFLVHDQSFQSSRAFA